MSDDTLPATTQWDDSFEHMNDALAEAAALAESPATKDIARIRSDRLWRNAAKVVTRFAATSRLLAPRHCSTAGDEPLIKLPAAPRAPLAVRAALPTP